MSPAEPCPISFVPHLRPQIWGGRHLAHWGRTLPEGTPIGESWELSTHPFHRSVIAGAGPWGGRTLEAVWRETSASLTGRSAEPESIFPLLVKLLDCREWLSIQVHPGDELARRTSQEKFGKTEAWSILHAEPDAEVFLGLQPGVTPDDLRALGALKSSQPGALQETLDRLFVRYRPEAGDFLLIRPGIPHAARGIVAWEIQTTCDLTYRIFDWNRRGPDGRPRDLHLEQALEAIDWTRPRASLLPSSKTLEGPSEWPRCFRAMDQPFGIEQWTVGPHPLPLPTGAMRILCTARGTVRLSGRAFDEVLPPGSLRLLPAGLIDARLAATGGEAEVLMVTGDG